MEIKANALIIIDPQNDFVKGSLAVPGAEEAMNNIIKFIEDHKQDLGYIAVTLDWHPLSHCSFKEFGGTWPIFIKSKEQKRITGKVIRNASDLVGLGYQEENPEIYISEVMDFVSEYRVFVRYGEVLDCKHYWGDPMVFLDAAIIKAAISKYQSAPDAYGIDFAVTKEGKTVLIEVNDAWALGCYGLEMHLYAKFLITRWAQITNTIDKFFYI